MGSINYNEKNKYDIGVLDMFMFAVEGTDIEDSPTIGAVLDEKVDEKRLYEAVNNAMKYYPLFKTKIVFDKKYYLYENSAPIIIFNEDDDDRTFTWKSGTNEYLWRLSFYNNKILLRWCHGVTDGRGAYEFFGAILKSYFGIKITNLSTLKLGFEHIYDKNEKGIPQKKQNKGFGKSALNIKKDESFTVCHILEGNTSEVIKLSKRNDASPATIIPIIYSKALRSFMKRKKEVGCNIVVDIRKPMKFETMHNCILAKQINYIDAFDNMEFEQISTIYRTLLDIAVLPENVIKEATKQVDDMNLIFFIKNEKLLKGMVRVLAKVLKYTIGDFTFTYLGKVDYGKEVNCHLKDFVFRSWVDYGTSNIAAIDLNGKFIMNICENYADKNVIDKFIENSKELGVNFTEKSRFKYYKAK